MSKTYILWIPHIIVHIETYYSGLFTDAEELFVPHAVQSYPKRWVTLDSNIFPFNLY